MNMEEKLLRHRREMIRLEMGDPDGGGIGATRFGGAPDVPAGFVWPTFETATYGDDEVKARPLAFLAQFNCAQLAPLDRDGLLPRAGLLSFFYELDSQRWGFDPADAGCARVCWFEDLSGLKRAEFPAGLGEDFRLPALGIRLSGEISLPEWEDFSRLYSGETDWDSLEEARAALGADLPDNCSKLLGWPDIIQSNMTQECELVSRGYYLGSTWEQIPQKDVEEAAAVTDWRLLFQLDTVEHEGFELMFGDCGRLYFYIREADLRARRFDRVWLILQCG